MIRFLHLTAGEATQEWVPVHWRLAECDWQGVTRVRVPMAMQDRAIVAELCALRYLLQVRQIFGGNLVPKGYGVSVTFSAIRKLYRKETEKSHLVPYGRFLFLALDGATMEIEQELAWTRSLQIDEEWRIDASHAGYEKIDVPGIGPVGISRHALERYCERNGTKTARAAFNGIRRLIAAEKTGPMEVDDRRRLKSILRHFKEPRLLVHEPSMTAFVIVKDGREDVMATVMVLEQPNRKLPVYVGGKIIAQR